MTKTDRYSPFTGNFIFCFKISLLSKLYFLFAALLFTPPVRAQQLPKVVLPTPEAAALFKYTEYPVNFSTGLPSVSVPLYTVQSGSISVPITANYHSSGRKVYDETGAIGLGWTLDAGGMISRTMYGEPDDDDAVIKFPAIWKKAADIGTTTADWDFLEGVSNNWYPVTSYDTEYDHFSFSAPGGVSGKFVLRDNNNVKEPVLLGKKSYLINCHKKIATPTRNYFDYITITDDKGVVYRFGKAFDDVEYHEVNYSGPAAKSSWMLTEIISADRIDTIFFKYQYFVKEKHTISQLTTFQDRYNGCDAGVTAPFEYLFSDDGLGTASHDLSGIQRIKEIKFRNGKIEFELKDNDTPEEDMVLAIHIKNAAGQNIKVVRFGQSAMDQVSDSNPPTKKLEAIKFEDGSGNCSDQYGFEYNPNTNNPAIVDIRGRDMWGYYNGVGTQMMRPYYASVPYVNSGSGSSTHYVGDISANRNPSLSAMQIGVLKKITFPTGGTTEFIYELNRYLDVNTYGGGLRLYQVKTNDSEGNTTWKTYKYGVNESGYGVRGLTPDQSNMVVETLHSTYTQGTADCVGTCPEYFYRRRIFHADVLPIFSELHNKPVFYSEVVEYHGTTSNNTGKTVYKYDGANAYGFSPSVMGLFGGGQLNQWKESSLIEKIDYKKVGSAYKKVYMTTNSYQETVYQNEKLWGLRVGRYYFRTPEYLNENGLGPMYPSYYPPREFNYCPTYDTYKYSDYTISVGKKELVSTTETSYDNNENVLMTSTKTFAYNANHLLSTTSTLNSTNETIVSETKYPTDFSVEGIYTTMIGRNMLNYPVEQNEMTNGRPIKSVKNQYASFIHPDIINVQSISARKGSGAYEKIIDIYMYDKKGSPLSVAKNDGTRISYIYDKSGLPLAEVVNAENTSYPTQYPVVVQNPTYTGTREIHFESFEDKPIGSGVMNTQGMSHAGTNYFYGDYQVSFTKPNAKNYVIEYFYFDSSTGKWNLIRKPYTGTSMTLSEGTAIDDIRIYPEDARMTTFTYQPLVGISSISDMNHNTSFYHYDNFGRLEFIRDKDGNILKTLQYHLKK
jgi:YD repeat-containing protein